MAASVGAASGAPWWLTVTLPIVSAAITHYLTTYRERLKANREWHTRWSDDAKKLVEKISNAAILHFVDVDAVGKTAVSASLIISDIKRLRNSIHEATCICSSDGKLTTEAMHAFDDAITAQDDFQDQTRAVRGATDGVCAQIRSCEQVLLSALQKPRRRRS